MSKPVAAVLSYMVPSPTGAGGPIGLHGHLLSVAGAGYDVHAIHIGQETANPVGLPYPVHSVKTPPNDYRSCQQDVADVLHRINCKLVWTHHAVVWPAFSPLRHEIPHVMLAGDPEWEMVALRQSLRKPPTSLKSKLRVAYRNWRELVHARREETVLMPEAGERGVLAGWSPNDVPGMRERTGLEIHTCSLAFPDWGFRPSRPRSDVVMIGNMTGTQTRLGIKHFFGEIWPHWKDSADAPASRVRVVGGGKLPDHFQRPEPHARLQWVGFVESIEEEWNTTVAHLVPVPTPLGFRVRIAESFCRGVPVLSDPSAEACLPMMKDGVNYLACRTPEQWMQAVRRLERDPEFADQLARNAREAFEQHLSIDAGIQRFGELSRLAGTRFVDTAKNRVRSLSS